MYELLQECIRPVNLPYTVLFGLCMLYWVMYLLGVLGSDFLDFMDLDLDLDADVDMDADFDGNVAAGHHGGVLVSVMKFLHAGDVPLTVIVTTMTMSMWVLSILVNYYLTNHNTLIAIALFLPFFFGSMVMTKISLKPFVPLLAKAFDETGDSVEIIGKLCVVISLEVTPKYGQAEVATKGSPIVIGVKTHEGETLKKGDEAVVFERDKEDQTYAITAFEVDSFKDIWNGKKPLEGRASDSPLPRESGRDPERDTKPRGED